MVGLHTEASQQIACSCRKAGQKDQSYDVAASSGLLWESCVDRATVNARQNRLQSQGTWAIVPDRFLNVVIYRIDFLIGTAEDRLLIPIKPDWHERKHASMLQPYRQIC